MTTPNLRQDAAPPLQAGTMGGSSAATNDPLPYLVTGPVNGQPADADLVFTFSEAIQAGVGNITVQSWDNGTSTVIDVTSGAVRISGSTLTLHLPQRLAYAASYWVSFDQNAIKDLAGQFPSYSISTSFQSGLSPRALDLTGTANSDTMHGSDLADTLSGGGGNDNLYGHGGNDLIHGGDETGAYNGDNIDGGDGNDTLYGDKGADRLVGGNGNDVLYGGDDNDNLEGGSGDDLLEGGAGDDMLYSYGGGKDTLRGGDGNDNLSGEHEGVLDGGAGNDTLTGYNGIDYSGGAGDDAISVSLDSTTKQASRIDGGTGNDRIRLSFYYSTNAQLSVSGGAGSDTFVLEGSIGNAAKDARIDIKDFTPGANGDVIDLRALLPYGTAGNPFAGGLVRLVAEGADTLLQMKQYASSTDFYTVLHLANVKPAQLTSDNFTGGIDPGGSSKGVTLTGTDQDDRLDGFLLDDTLRGLDGDDSLYGQGGDDTLDGGAGDDVLVGGAGNDSLAGGLGNDTLSDDQGDNRLEGGDGNDLLQSTSSGSSLLDGGAGNDTVTGGSGNDTLSGGAGDDTIRVSDSYSGTAYKVGVLGGDGKDLLVFDNIGRATVTAGGGAGADTFQFTNSGYGYYNSPAAVTIADFDAADGDSLDLLALLPNDLGANPFGTAGFLKAEQAGSDVNIYLDRDGAALTTYAYIRVATLKNISLSSLAPAAFAGGLAIDGSNHGMRIDGAAGADTLTGGWLDDTIDGGDGADLINGGPGNDSLRGGDDTGVGGDTLFGGVGDDTLDGGTGDDVLQGGGGNDSLLGGAGNDTLQGDEGNDSLYGGDGNDFLSDTAGNNLLDGGAGNDVINAASFYSNRGNATIEGGAGDDTITAGSGNDIVHGGDGNDTIQINLDPSNAYRVTVDGGEGDDNFLLVRDYNTSLAQVEITGGAGRDTYGWNSYYSPGDSLTIADFQAGAGGDRIDIMSALRYTPLTQNPFAAGYARLVASGADTLLQLDPDGNATGQGFGTIAILKGVAPETLTGDNFVGGMRPDGSLAGLDLLGGSGNDTLNGGFLDDTIHGGDGDDSINGGTGGNDWLYGDDGNDYLRAYAGTAHLAGGAGDDTLIVNYGNNFLDGGDGDDLVYVNPDSDGSNALAGGGGNDTLDGGGGADTLDGGAGNDLLYGGRGDDLLIGGAGRDSATYSGPPSAFSVTRDAGGWHVTHLQPIVYYNEGSDALQGVERVLFYNQVLALDTDGSAGQAYRIYRAAFDREPDLDGLGFWIGKMDAGVSLHDVAAGFVRSQEFADLYGAAPSNADIVTRLYQNILHRAPDQTGYDFWLGILDNKLADLPDVVAAISEGAENQEAVAALIANGIAYTPYGG